MRIPASCVSTMPTVRAAWALSMTLHNQVCSIQNPHPPDFPQSRKLWKNMFFQNKAHIRHYILYACPFRPTPYSTREPHPHKRHQSPWPQSLCRSDRRHKKTPSPILAVNSKTRYPYHRSYTILCYCEISCSTANNAASETKERLLLISLL